MSILKIARMGNPILKRKAEPVADPAAPEIQRLVADMKDTLEDIGGAGLAAPQVYVAKRVVVYRIPAERIPPGSEQTPVGWTTLINPVVEPLSDEMKMNWERCLSVPGLHGKVARHTKIRCTYTTLANRPVEIVAQGFHAMVLQHECDHLDGIVFPMRMTDLSFLSFDSELGDKGFRMPWTAEDF